MIRAKYSEFGNMKDCMVLQFVYGSHDTLAVIAEESYGLSGQDLRVKTIKIRDLILPRGVIPLHGD